MQVFLLRSIEKINGHWELEFSKIIWGLGDARTARYTSNTLNTIYSYGIPQDGVRTSQSSINIFEMLNHKRQLMLSSTAISDTVPILFLSQWFLRYR